MTSQFPFTPNVEVKDDGALSSPPILEQADVVNRAAGIDGMDISRGIFGGGAPTILGSTERVKQVQYWHKCQGCEYHTEENNWITVGPVMTPRTAVEYTEFMQNKHATPLPQYGQYIMGYNAKQKYDLTNQRTKFQAIIELGGIKEFPLDQMIAYNWHRIPVMVNLIPALGNIVDIPCPYCAGRKFVHELHLQQHIQAMHREVMQSEAVGRQFNNAITSLNGTTNLNAEQIALIIKAVMDNMAPKEVH